MASFHIKGRRLDKDLYTEKIPAKTEAETRAGLLQGMPVSAKKAEAKEEVWAASITAFKRSQPCQHLDLGLWPSGAERQHISSV